MFALEFEGEELLDSGPVKYLCLIVSLIDVVSDLNFLLLH